jgi:hypothetical protein
VAVVDKADWIVWCDTCEAEGPGPDQVVLIVGVGHTLPRKVIEFGNKAEIMHAGFPAEKRESLSEDFLYEFLFPADQKLVVSRLDLFERLDEIAEQIPRKYIKR